MKRRAWDGGCDVAFRPCRLTKHRFHCASLSDVLYGRNQQSRAELEQTLGTPVNAIAYPWGRHDANVERLAKETGYEGGFSVRRRMNFENTPIYALRRIGVNHTTSLKRFAWDLFRLRWRGE